MSLPRKARVLCACGCGHRAGVVYQGQAYRDECARKLLRLQRKKAAKQLGNHKEDDPVPDSKQEGA